MYLKKQFQKHKRQNKLHVRIVVQYYMFQFTQNILVRIAKNPLIIDIYVIF